MYASFMLFQQAPYFILEYFKNFKVKEKKSSWLWSWDDLSVSKRTYHLDHLGSKGQMLCLMGQDTLYLKALHTSRQPFLLELFHPQPEAQEE